MRRKSIYHSEYCPVHDPPPEGRGTESLCAVLMRMERITYREEEGAFWVVELCYMCGLDISETFEYHLIWSNPNQNDWMCPDCYVAAMFNDPRDVGPTSLQIPPWTWGSC